MDGQTFSDGSRVTYLAAGYYLVSRGARISRVQDPDQDNTTTTNTDVESDNGRTVSTEPAAQLEDIARQAITANEDSQDGVGFANEDIPELEGHQEDQVDETFVGYDQAPTPNGPYYENDSEMADEDQPDNHPSVGGLTVASQGPPQRIRVPHQGNYVAQNLLSKAHFARLAATTYDPLWIENNNVNPAVMNGFTSRIKLEEMFGRGVFEPEDVFQIVEPSGAIYTAKEAFVSSPTLFQARTVDTNSNKVHSFPAARNAFPDFRVHTLATRRDHFMPACNGIGPLYMAMAAPGTSRRPNYSTFQVSRNGQVLGNLSDLRQALHVYLAEKQNWERQG
jgi:hypothetical protein